MPYLKQFVESTQVKARSEDARVNALSKHLHEENWLLLQARAEQRAEKKREKREHNEIVTAEERKLRLDADEKVRMERESVIALESAVAHELLKRNAVLSSEKRRESEIAHSEEILLLKEKLAAARVNRERAVQLMDLARARAADSKRVAQEDKKMLESYYEAMDAEARKEKDGIEKANALRKQTLSDLQTRARARTHEYETERQQDRHHTESLVAQIRKEDEQERELARHRKLEVQKSLTEFEEAQKRRKEEEAAHAKAEDERIANYLIDKARRDSEFEKQTMAAHAAKARLVAAIAQKHTDANLKAEELANLRNDLFLYESELKRLDDERRDLQKRQDDRIRLRTSYDDQLRGQAQLRVENAVKEAILTKQLLDAHEAELEKSRMSEAQRRQARAKYRRDMDSFMEDRKQRFIAEQEAELAALRDAEERDNARKLAVQKERERLLLENGEELRIYLAPDLAVEYSRLVAQKAPALKDTS